MSDKGVSDASQSLRVSYKGVSDVSQSLWVSDKGVSDASQSLRVSDKGVSDASQSLRVSDKGVSDASQSLRVSYNYKGVNDSSHTGGSIYRCVRSPWYLLNVTSSQLETIKSSLYITISV